MTERKTPVCFAYFVDGQFTGWYGDSFGSVVQNSPKIYSYTPSQVAIIKKNFSYKINTVNTTTVKDELAELGRAALTSSSEREVKGHQLRAVVALARHSGEEVLAGKQVELRVVECPIYDGPNPDFDKIAYEKAIEVETTKLKAMLKERGIDWEDGPSQQRSAIVELFRKDNPRVKCDNWIYADYTKVKEWASNEPTVFLEIIKPQDGTLGDTSTD